MSRTSIVLLVISSFVFGCNTPAPNVDAGTSPVGDAGSDAAAIATDDAGTDAHVAVDAASGDAVAQCQAAVDAVIAACASPTAQRACIYRAYRALCAQGRTAVVTAVMQCLLMDSCQTASDPSGAASCVNGVVTPNRNTAHDALGTALCTCDGTSTGCPDYPTNGGAELIMLSDADAQTVASCLNGPPSECATPTTCYERVPFGVAFDACLAM